MPFSTLSWCFCACPTRRTRTCASSPTRRCSSDGSTTTWRRSAIFSVSKCVCVWCWDGSTKPHVVDVTDSLTMKPSGWQLSPCEELHQRHQRQRDLHRAALPGDYITPLFVFFHQLIFLIVKNVCRSLLLILVWTRALWRKDFWGREPRFDQNLCKILVTSWTMWWWGYDAGNGDKTIRWW